MPVRKEPDPVPEESVLGDRTNMVYAGTTISSGRGQGYVVATGINTELGAIFEQVQSAEQVKSPLEQRMGRFAQIITVAVVLSAALAFAIGITRGDPLEETFTVAVAIAVFAIPEGLPIAITIALAIGVRRMANRNAIVRHLPAVETLGSTTSIGSDKTGTLTENRMTVQRIWRGERTLELADVDANAADQDEALRKTLLAGVLTNEAALEETDEGWKVHGDPTEGALLMAAHTCGIDSDAVQREYPVLGEIPFESMHQFSASIREIDGQHVVWAKGSPERILDMSTSMHAADGVGQLDSEKVMDAAHDLADQGLRVLAMGYGVLPSDAGDPKEISEPSDLTFAGLAGMQDPPREGVQDAITACRDAGIRTIMITGDHASTAIAIGRDLGIADERSGDALTGAELANHDEQQLRQAVPTTDVYARVAPEQKLQVVQALQANDEIVAVTGDGVNDAPALKAADIGIAMGRDGTDVAREAADIVLTDDNFVSIVAAVEEGRVSFDNIRKVTYFLIGMGVAGIITILVAMTMGWPVPFVAAQILWLNLVTSGLQDVALAFEPGEPDILKRKPRSRHEGIISRLLWERTAIVAAVMSAGTVALFMWEYDRSGSLVQAQSIALTTMVFFQVFQVGNSRSEIRSVFKVPLFSNRFLFLATGAALILHIGALYFPLTQTILRVEPIHADAWWRMLAVASTVLVASELHKWLRRPKGHTTPSV